jgi:hypothetical protein
MVLRWLFNLKYIIGIPDTFLTSSAYIKRSETLSSETPNEGGHKKPPIPTPAKRIPRIQHRPARRPAVRSQCLAQVVCDLEPVAVSCSQSRWSLPTIRASGKSISVTSSAADFENPKRHAASRRHPWIAQTSSRSISRDRTPKLSKDRMKPDRKDPETDQRSEREAVCRRRELPVCEGGLRLGEVRIRRSVGAQGLECQKLGEKLKETEKSMNDYKAELDKTTLDLRAANRRTEQVHRSARSSFKTEGERYCADYARLQHD